MGHAGAIISGGKGGAEDKIEKMEECGITIAKSPSDIGKTLFKNCLIENYFSNIILNK